MTPLPVPDDFQPAFAGQRPPFAKGNEWRAKPGNDLAVKHGIHSLKIIDPIADGIIEEILSDPDVEFLHRPSFRLALRRYARAAARVERLEEWIAEMTPEQAAYSDRGQTSPLELLRRVQVMADNEANRLGLDPTGWARVRKDFAVTRRVDIATLLSAHRDADERGESTEHIDRLAAEQYPDLFGEIEAGNDG